MKVDWLMLANYAEAPPNTGVVYIMGGAWDTLTVGAPLEGAPPGVVAVLQGYLAMRLLFHRTELGRDRQFEIVVLDEDGTEAGRIEGGFRPEAQPGIPPSWDHGFNLVFPLNGLGLVKFGLYTIHVTLDGTHLAERPFRVIKGY
jgi:hypothetical protein